MSKVLILEEQTHVPQSGYDHVFSFRAAPADSFPDHYLSAAEADSLYEEVYDALSASIEAHPFASWLSHRGIDLLWCFKKSIFEQAYLAVIRYEILQRVIHKFPGGQFYLERLPKNSKGSHLSEILEGSPFKTAANIRWIGEVVPEKISREDCPPNSFLPPMLVLGDLRRQSVATCYDFQKAQGVLRHLKQDGYILLSNSQPRRMFFNALLHRASLCQIHYRPQDGIGYTKICSELIERARREPGLFAGLRFRGLEVQNLLRSKLCRVFEESLPRLLFEIDRFHDFFSAASSLKSILLDEDISPPRRALCKIARSRGVQTFVECHGVIGGKHGFVPPAADKMFVWGEAQKKKLVMWGAPEEQIIISGYSRYTAYQKMDSVAVRRSVAKKFGLDPSKKIVLLAFPPITHSWFVIFEQKMRKVIEQTLAVVAELLGSIPQMQVVLKVHPADHEKSWYRDWLKKNHPERFVIVENYDSLLLAKAADFLIVYQSTYAVDGFALGKPVISLWDDSNFFDEFKPYKVFTEVKSAKELREAILKFLNGFVPPANWQEARRACLNENGEDPDRFIASVLKNGVSLVAT